MTIRSNEKVIITLCTYIWSQDYCTNKGPLLVGQTSIYIYIFFCNTKWAVYVIMCDACGMQYVGQTNNIRSSMNGHGSHYRRFLNGDFSKSDTSSLYSHLITHDFNIFKFQILSILENEGCGYTKDIRQLETSLDAKERYLIWKLESLIPQGLNVADTFHSQYRSSKKKRSRFFTFV